jgi:hypothetical protein
MVAACATGSSVATMKSASALPDSGISLISTPRSGDPYTVALINAIDDEHYSFGNWHVKVKPGWHTVTLFIPDLKIYPEYKIFTKAGKRYDLTGARQGWEITRNAAEDSQFLGAKSSNPTSPMYLDNSNTFVDAENYKKVEQENAQRRLDQIAEVNLMKEEAEAIKRRNLPYIRKVGARICKDDKKGHTFIGYVENMTDEKIQIRISDALWNTQGKVNENSHVSGFTPSIIWDNPMNWTSCEVR